MFSLQWAVGFASLLYVGGTVYAQHLRTTVTRLPSSPNVTTISWASQPVRPGSGVMLQGAPFRNSTLVEMAQAGSGGAPLRWEAVETAGATPHGLVAMVPAAFEYNEFLVRADNGPAFPVNRADPWWVFGDQGDTCTPGGYFRLFGTALMLKEVSQAMVYLHDPAGNRTIPLAASLRRQRTFSEFHLWFDLPVDVVVGNYEISVANSPTSAPVALCTFLHYEMPCDKLLRVVAPSTVQEQWAARSHVVVVNAPQPGYGRDATPAVQQALEQARPGTVVLFPRGQYFLKEFLDVPEGVLLAGEATHLVSLYFPEDNSTTAPQAYINSTATSWGLQNMTVYVTAYFNSVVSTATQTVFFRMSGVRLMATTSFCHEPDPGNSQRGRTVSWNMGTGQAINLVGRNLFITDNIIYSSGDVFSTRFNNPPGASFMHIANNEVFNGMTAHWGVSWKQAIFENNIMQGASPFAMGSNYPQYNHSSDQTHVQNIYHCNNSYSFVWGNDREMMTFDGGGGVYFGGLQQQQRWLHLTTRAQDTQLGGAVCVIAGTGTGQCKRVLEVGDASAGGTVPNAFDNIVVVPCSTNPEAVEWRALDNNTFVSAAQPNLYLTIDCAPPGKDPSNASTCGSQFFPEPLLLEPTNPLIVAAQANKFVLPPESGGYLRSLRSGQCLSVVTPVQELSPVLLMYCDNNGTVNRWRRQGQQFVELSTGMCLGVSSINNLALWSVDAPFDPPLDSTSSITIMPYVGRVLFNSNRYSDGGAVQLYTQAIEVIVANNTFTRTGGLSAWGRQEETTVAWGANLMIQFLGNSVLEGNHVYNYNTQPTPPNGSAYYPGGSKTIEPWFIASMTNDQGEPVDPFPPRDFTGALNRFVVMRGNIVENNGGLLVRGTTANALLEDNHVFESDVGIYVNYSTTQGGIVLLRNSIPEGVPDNYNPYADNESTSH